MGFYIRLCRHRICQQLPYQQQMLHTGPLKEHTSARSFVLQAGQIYLNARAGFSFPNLRMYAADGKRSMGRTGCADSSAVVFHPEEMPLISIQWWWCVCVCL